mmetsp:Transcript_8346/g.10945  ORF Transcript_8346/g.10945 Transcript_8346/m.10945 type:complete len:189 (-) Transcript_8346:123-689(-)|eukprot:CAMPEP_0198143224 /NCGR_PEP_ID=MMETSP1443-20131203/6114_1 /TAXON_ID=186043 /ORGANISM="Entomoneis sp., Strain CCMP2396" /LENGTH=188 /DNA_ID=CAMNT_0043806423 /DNA_START=132 /DNA_END=698 /DNA_ORIENTATION=+
MIRATSQLFLMQRSACWSRRCLLSTQTASVGQRPPSLVAVPNSSFRRSYGSIAAAEPESSKRSPLLMGIGGTIVLLCTIDTFLLYQDEKDKKDRMTQLSKEESVFRDGLLKKWKDKPTILHSKAIIKYEMGGTMGLRNVVVGDSMEVLEQNTGPNNNYSLCRTRDEDGNIVSIGWYPMEMMEEIRSEK